MTAKHAPATPLPWSHFRGTNSSQILGKVRDLEQVVADLHDFRHAQNAAYIEHSCNAYPRLVELLKLAANGEHLAFKRAVGLLRELGELE